MKGYSFTASKQDPIFGINHANIVPVLTPDNWRTKAIVRDGFYIWVARGTVTEKPKKEVWRFCVLTHDGDRKTRIVPFRKRDHALGYATRISGNQIARPKNTPNVFVIS